MKKKSDMQENKINLTYIIHYFKVLHPRCVLITVYKEWIK